MIQTVAISEKTSLHALEKHFGLQLVADNSAFPEWQTDLPALTSQEKQRLDQVKANFLSPTARSLISENLVKTVVISPSLELAGVYRTDMQIRDKVPIEISDQDEKNLLAANIPVPESPSHPTTQPPSYSTTLPVPQTFRIEEKLASKFGSLCRGARRVSGSQVLNFIKSSFLRQNPRGAIAIAGLG